MDKVRGTHLRDHICDEKTWWLTKDLIERARTHFLPSTMTYRCDTSDRARQFVMIADKVGTHVKLTHHLLSDTKAGPIISLVETGISAQEVDRCSICNRFLLDDEWVDPFTLERDMEFIPRHVVCNECEQVALRA